MNRHKDILEGIDQNIPLKEKVKLAHSALQTNFPFIVRIAVAIYDPHTKILKTYIHSSERNENPLEHYQTLLEDAPSLIQILNEKNPRVINNIQTFETGKHEHTLRIERAGYKASYTMPIFNEGDFFGFLFFNSDRSDVFTEDILSRIDVYSHLISLLIISDSKQIQTLSAAIKTTGHITHLRDPETGSHLDRMSRYTQLIARKIADQYNLDDNYIQHLFMFAPLHDIGKIGIPDSILLKNGPLNDEERKIMKTHASKGVEMIDEMIANFGLKNIEYIDVLRNLAGYHHEAVNGSGYPEGKSGNEIPIEARIVAVADIFDALTSERSYKKAWTNKKAIAFLKEISGVQLDKDCVQALLNSMDEVIEIQTQFKESKL